MAEPILDKRFKSDKIFNQVNKQFITLKDEERKAYNVHLETVLDNFVQLMKQSDPMFNASYERIVYVGSFYEGLKVGKPDEFDLNVIIKLPINYNDLTTEFARVNGNYVARTPGYISIKADSNVLPKLRKHNRWAEYKVMESWFDENSYLNQNKFRQWFESVATKALNLLNPRTENWKYTIAQTSRSENRKYAVGNSKSGPAWTLKIDVRGEHSVDVDILPVLEFSTVPPGLFRNHNTTRTNWLTIAKPLDVPNGHILWKPSFYERELEILKGSIKQVIRQMKKLRDTQNFKGLASYFIKTLFLWELDKQGPDFQKLPSTFLFFYMLKKLHEACTEHEIPDFWNPGENLLSRVSRQEMMNIRDRLNRIINTIDRRIEIDPFVVAEFILTPDELDQLKLSGVTNAMASTYLG